MAEDFYQDDYLQNGGGGYYDGGGISPDYVPGFEPDGGSFWSGQIGTGEQIGTPDTTGDIFLDYVTDYLHLGYDLDTAYALAQEDMAITPTFEIGVEPTAMPLPEIPAPADTYFPYYPYNYWETPPYIPPFDIEPPPPPPGPQLPPYCPVGTYHPYPIGHPQQDVCAPFPAAMTRQQRPGPTTPTQPPSHPPAPAPRPSGQQPTQRPRPPAQQQQRCQPPLVFDQATGRCVPQGQAISPLPIPTEAQDMFADLKKLPWWVWVAGAGLLLLGMGGEERKTTTVRYKRG